MLVEIIVTSLEEALLAEQYGADRLEVIHDFQLGGLSPTLALSKAIAAAVTIPVCIMVRPHGRNFIYTPDEAAQILEEIRYLRDHTQAYGIVFGALTPAGTLDTELLEQVLTEKGHLALTFHRAIDAAITPMDCLQALLAYNDLDFILTSGGKPTALEGITTIKQMVTASQQRIKILAGSGITPDNAPAIIDATGVTQIHLGTGVRTNMRLDPEKFRILKKVLP